MGKYALITGAASGMGRIYASRLAARGYSLALVDINGEGLESLALELRPMFVDDDPKMPSVVCIEQNLADEDAVARIAARLEQSAPGAEVEVLVNNAGMIFTSEIADTDPEKLRAMMMVHCVTPLLLCRQMVPAMKARGRGYVLNISSICAWMHWPAIGMYGNTKAFVRNYTRSLRVEYRGSGVGVTTAVFGAVDTPLFGFSQRTRRAMKRWGLMIEPETAVDKALGALFRRRKRIVPGFLNRVSIPVVSVISERTIRRLYLKFGHLLTK